MIVRDCSNTALLFAAKYKGRRFVFSGTVTSIGRDSKNFIARLEANDNDFHGIIFCRFVSTMEAKLKALSFGQYVTLSGSHNGYIASV